MENFTQETLTDVKIAREHFINRVEVLEKVKDLNGIAADVIMFMSSK